MFILLYLIIGMLVVLFEACLALIFFKMDFMSMTKEIGMGIIIGSAVRIILWPIGLVCSIVMTAIKVYKYRHAKKEL